MEIDAQEKVEALKKALMEQEHHRAKSRQWAAMVTALLSIIGSSLVATQLFEYSSPLLPRRDNTVQYEITQLNEQLKTLQLRVTQMGEVSEKMKKNVASSGQAGQQARLAAALENVEKRLGSLETVILESPERAISIPLIRKDLDESGKRLEEFKTSSRAELDRIYEQQRWILGGIGTVLLAVAGGAITILLRSIIKSKEPDNA